MRLDNRTTKMSKKVRVQRYVFKIYFVQIRVQIYFHKKVLRPAIIQCASYDYKKRKNSVKIIMFTKTLRENGREAVKTINL